MGQRPIGLKLGTIQDHARCAVTLSDLAIALTQFRRALCGVIAVWLWLGYGWYRLGIAWLGTETGIPCCADSVQASAMTKAL